MKSFITEMAEAWQETNLMDRLLVTLVLLAFGIACFIGGFITEKIY